MALLEPAEAALPATRSRRVAASARCLQVESTALRWPGRSSALARLQRGHQYDQFRRLTLLPARVLVLQQLAALMTTTRRCCSRLSSALAPHARTLRTRSSRRRTELRWLLLLLVPQAWLQPSAAPAPLLLLRLLQLQRLLLQWLLQQLAAASLVRLLQSVLEPAVAAAAVQLARRRSAWTSS